VPERYPPFRVQGDPEGDFFALAFVEGTYVSPTGATREEGFLVLRFSPTPEFTRLSLHTCTRAGQPLAYSRGVDRHDTPEFVLLEAWYEYRLPPHAWALYPIEAARAWWAGASRAHEPAYWAARKGLSSVLYHMRAFGWSRHLQQVQPLFFPAEGRSVSSPFDPSPENEELLRSVVDDDD
jgi:hypothetical protein